eukprot:CAMPEP_0201873082 /NCGR_PEP_ID=MMETSP0902-20130614/5678_1 /ASSEMBLY_ACC=CAM_ASM_000551 /TAXON_ID=420261 /ORGANISM="Thalassiosira antarctica, Strain CCMP982" /LENGTH=72 /DNA_ID=CAMNT_0048399581 /DNA_START=210 /DNA_END=428 /DNA_ORIENTATION=+
MRIAATAATLSMRVKCYTSEKFDIDRKEVEWCAKSPNCRVTRHPSKPEGTLASYGHRTSPSRQSQAASGCVV